MESLGQGPYESKRLGIANGIYPRTWHSYKAYEACVSFYKDAQKSMITIVIQDKESKATSKRFVSLWDAYADWCKENCKMQDTNRDDARVFRQNAKVLKKFMSMNQQLNIKNPLMFRDSAVLDALKLLVPRCDDRNIGKCQLCPRRR